MKYFTVIYLSLFLAFLTFASCNSSNPISKNEEVATEDDSNEEEEEQPKKKKKKRGLNTDDKKTVNEDLIVGKWEEQTEDGKVIRIFKEDGHTSTVYYENGKFVGKNTGMYNIIDDVISIHLKGFKESEYKIKLLTEDKLVFFNKEDIDDLWSLERVD